MYIQNNDLNPVWNEHFEFIVEDPSSQFLTVRIFDDDGIQDAEFLGTAHVRLKELEPGKVKEFWLKLVKDLGVQRDNKNRGEVRLPSHYRLCNIFSSSRLLADRPNYLDLVSAA